MSRVRRFAVCSAAAIMVGAFAAAPAAAHVTANPGHAEADGYAKVDMRVPHGCEDGQPTRVLAVQIPEGVVSVKPEQVPGWDVATEIGPFDEPVELHGEQITEGVKTVTWTAQEGNELPDSLFREFGISMKLPDRPGEMLYFPAVQTCTGGSETAWIEVPEQGGDAHELEHPAPSLTLTAAGSGHGSTAGAAADPALATASGGGVLPSVALAVGAAGALTGGAALVAVRRRRPLTEEADGGR